MLPSSVLKYKYIRAVIEIKYKRYAKCTNKLKCVTTIYLVNKEPYLEIIVECMVIN